MKENSGSLFKLDKKLVQRIALTMETFYDRPTTSNFENDGQAKLCGALYGGEGSSGCSLRPVSAGWSAGIRTARKRIKAFAPWKTLVPVAPEYGDQYSQTI